MMLVEDSEGRVRPARDVRSWLRSAGVGGAWHLGLGWTAVIRG